MSEYCIEGMLKEITVVDEKVAFRLEPVAPYIFEKKRDDDSTERCLLLVDNRENPSVARVVKTDRWFAAPAPLDFHSLLIAKANHMKVRLNTDEKAIEQIPLVVSKIEML